MNEIINDINKRISIIIPYAEESAYFERCLCSFTRQSLKNFRIYVPNKNISQDITAITKKYSERLMISTDFENVSDIIKNTSDEYTMFISPESAFSMSFIENMLTAQDEHPDSFISCGYELASEKCNNIRLANIYGKLYMTDVLKKSELISYNENAFTSFVFNINYMAASERRFINADAHIYDAYPEKYFSDFDYDFRKEFRAAPEREEEIKTSLREKWENVLKDFFENDDVLSTIISSDAKYSSIDSSQFIELTQLLLEQIKPDKTMYFDIIGKLINKSIEFNSLGLYSSALEKFILPAYNAITEKISFSSEDEEVFEYICGFARKINENGKTEYCDVFNAIFGLTDKKAEYLLKSSLHDFCIYNNIIAAEKPIINMLDVKASETAISAKSQETLLKDIENIIIKNVKSILNDNQNNNASYSMDNTVSAFAEGKLGIKAALKCVSACFKYKFSRK